MADIKISELEPTTDLEGLYTIGSDKNNLSKKVSLQFLKDAANYANEQGDYAKQAGDTVNGNVGVSDYPEFSAYQSYVIGDIVRYNGVLYAFTANHAASAWNGSDVKATSINAITSGKLTELESETRVYKGDSIKPVVNRNYQLIRNDGSLETLTNDDYECSQKINITGYKYIEYLETWDAVGAYIGVCLYDSNNEKVAGFYGTGLIDLSNYPSATDVRYFGSLNENPAIRIGMEIKDGHVVEESLKDIIKNLQEKTLLEVAYKYDNTNVATNYLLLKSNGATIELVGDSYDTTDFIDISGATKIETNVFPLGGGYAGLCSYDSNKAFIKAYGGEISLNVEELANAKYIRASIVRTNPSSFLKIIRRESANFDDIYKYSKEYTDSKLGDSQAELTIVKVGEGEQFATIQDAVESIVDASEFKRYEIFVKSGIYDISNAGISRIPIKPYINIVGENKATTHIIMRLASYQSTYNIFENIGGFVGDAEVRGFTMTTEKCKGALHLDDQSWKGTITFKDCIINDIEDETKHDESKDYYIYMAASYGAINLGLHINQNIVIENVTTNGYIYSHTLPRNFTDMESKPSNFIVRNCVCDWLAVYANGEKVRKNCVFEGNKCNFIKIEFDDTYNLGYMAWDVLLNNNNTGFVQGLYIPYGGSVATIQNLWDNHYNGIMPCPDMMIHKYVQNLGTSRIGRGNKVVFTDATKRYIAIANSETEYDAITLCTIEPNGFGVIQDGGDLKAFANYISNHSFEKL